MQKDWKIPHLVYKSVIFPQQMTNITANHRQEKIRKTFINQNYESLAFEGTKLNIFYRLFKTFEHPEEYF